MGATYNFNLGFAQGTESKAETPDRLVKRQPLQEICTGMSLVGLCLGFSVFGMLIIVNRYQAGPNGLSGDSFVAAAGGIGAILVGMAFLFAACLHWRFCARRSAAPSDRRQSGLWLRSTKSLGPPHDGGVHGFGSARGATDRGGTDRKRSDDRAAGRDFAFCGAPLEQRGTAKTECCL